MRQGMPTPINKRGPNWAAERLHMADLDDEDDREDADDENAEEHPQGDIAYDFEDDTDNTDKESKDMTTKPQTQSPALAPKTRAVRRGGGLLGGMRQPSPPPTVMQPPTAAQPKAAEKPEPQASAAKTTVGLGSPQPPAPSQPYVIPDILTGLELDKFLAFAAGEPGYDIGDRRHEECPVFFNGFRREVCDNAGRGLDSKAAYRKTVDSFIEFICSRRLGGVDNAHLEVLLVYLMIWFFEKNGVKPEVALPSARKWVQSEVTKKLAELKAKTAEYEVLAAQPQVLNPEPPAPSPQPDASLARTVEAPTPVPASKAAPASKPAAPTVTKAKTPQERVREAVATEVARGGFEPPEEAPPAAAPRVARTPPPLPLAPVVFVPREPAAPAPQPDTTPSAQPAAKPEAEPKPRKPGIGGMDPAKRRRLIDKARSLTGEDKERFETYRPQLDKSTWLLDELADAETDEWLGMLEGALGAIPAKPQAKPGINPLYLAGGAFIVVCLLILGIGAAVKSNRQTTAPASLPSPTPTAVQVAPATQVASPTFVCEPVTPGLTQTHLGQPDPTHFTDSGKKTIGGPYVDCNGARILKNPGGTYNITYCRVCYPK